jgi:hypothetical protein
MRLEDSAVPGDHRRGAHRLVADGDVDVLAQQGVRHAVTHRHDVDERVRRDTPADALLTARQRTRGPRAHRRLLVAREAIARRSCVLPFTR